MKNSLQNRVQELKILRKSCTKLKIQEKLVLGPQPVENVEKNMRIVRITLLPCVFFQLVS